MKCVNSNALSFDDILLVPSYSEITSRLDPLIDLSTKLSRNVTIQNPLISTNMSSVTEEDMLLAMNSIGSIGCMHRFDPIDIQEARIFKAKELGLTQFILSIGVKPTDYNNIERLISMNPTAILLDIAHGDSIQAHNMLKELKSQTTIDIIAGNVCTKDGYKRLVDIGADGVRAGVGPGSVCDTRVVTGNGVPQLQAIMDCAEVADPNVPIIADGGIKGSQDIIKALAAGASSVCLGSVLAGTSHTPGQIYSKNDYNEYYPVSQSEVEAINKLHTNGLFKEYYGMSSSHVQHKYKGGMKAGIAAEGSHTFIKYKGDTVHTLQNLLGGLRSGFTYQGVCSIKELQDNAEYMILSPGSIKESKH